MFFQVKFQCTDQERKSIFVILDFSQHLRYGLVVSRNHKHVYDRNFIKPLRNVVTNLLGEGRSLRCTKIISS